MYFPPNQNALLDSINATVCPGNPADPAYEESVADSPFPYITALGHVPSNATLHADKKTKLFSVSLQEYVRDSIRFSTIQQSGTIQIDLDHIVLSAAAQTVPNSSSIDISTETPRKRKYNAVVGPSLSASNAVAGPSSSPTTPSSTLVQLRPTGLNLVETKNDL